MKQWSLSLFALLCCFLAACGRNSKQESASIDPNTANHFGRYICTSVTMDDLNLGPEGQWISLQGGNNATVFLSGQPEEGQWTLSGNAFTMTMGGETIAIGTLENGTLTVNLMGTDCVFLREDQLTSAAADTSTTESPEKNTSETAVFTCYGDLYRVLYPTQRFTKSSDGLTDLTSENGTCAWISRLESKDLVTEWLTGFDEKAMNPAYQNYQSINLTVASYPARAIIYQEDSTWHSKVLVDFGRDAGTQTHPMYAACLYFSGPTQEDVWGADIQTMVYSLRLLS